MYFIDGENLVMRYQAMIDDGGWKPKKDVIHKRDVYVWREGLTEAFVEDIVRMSYYTSCVGSHDELDEIAASIKGLAFRFRHGSFSGGQGEGTIFPRVFKKARRSTQTRAVDINITIDILRHTYDNSVDSVILLSGDGDFIPLAQEVMRKGKSFTVMAFSSGLNPKIPVSVDDFFHLDSHYFLPRT